MTCIYENIFHTGKWAGIFQFTETAHKSLCESKNIIDVSLSLLSPVRPAGVDGDYVEAKGHPHESVLEKKRDY